ncbi:MAG: hypothetical protein PVSMB4_05220 [Ktedonobacterales bacterium]
MPDNATIPGIPNPFDLWRQWYESHAGPWLGALGDDNARYLDPFGLVSAFAQERPTKGPGGTPDLADLWTQWFTAALRAGTHAVGTAQSAGASVHGQQSVGDASDRPPNGAGLPTDPITAYRRWYEATNQDWSKVAGKVVSSEAFIELVSRSVETYTSAMRSLRRSSEAQLSALQLPTRTDVARVASLVIALEAKVERIEDVLDDSLTSAKQSAQARADEMTVSLTVLEERLSRVEGKMDAVLSTLADLLASQQRDTPAAANGVRRSPTSGRSASAAASRRVASQAVASNAAPPPEPPSTATRRRRGASTARTPRT